VREQPDPRRATVAAYDASARAYASANPVLPDSVRADLDSFSRRLPPGARVLEVGSAAGRDAALLEELGLQVHRTDVTPAFVALLREQGHDADVLDPLVDDVVGPYDGVWANASLLHVLRADLVTVLQRLGSATRPGGLLRFSVKEGDGEGWSTHGAVAAPRHFTFWRAGPLTDAVVAAGWTDVLVRSGIAGKRQETWLEVSAVRP